MNLTILQQYTGPNINQNPLLSLTKLSKKTYSALTQTARSDLKLKITPHSMKKVFKKVDTTNHWHPGHEIMPKKRGVKSHAWVPLKVNRREILPPHL